MKKVILVFLSVMLCVLVCACDDNGNQSSAPDSQVSENNESNLSSNSENESSVASDVESSVEATESSIDEVESSVDESKIVDDSSVAVPQEVEFTAEFVTDDMAFDADSVHFYNDPSEYAGDVVFTTNAKVTNVRVLEINLVDMIAGVHEYEVTEVLYTLKTLEPGEFLVAGIVMGELIPIRGISFDTSDGKTHYYSLIDSPMDGSLVFSKQEKVIEGK